MAHVHSPHGLILTWNIAYADSGVLSCRDRRNDEHLQLELKENTKAVGRVRWGIPDKPVECEGPAVNLFEHAVIGIKEDDTR